MCNQKNVGQPLDVQGHRGCRGLMPENTIEGFLYAIDLGVHTLEMDLVISADNKVIVSHEPFFHHLISTAPDGVEITDKNARDLNLYKMTVEEIQKYDVGIKLHPNFPHQKKMPCVKPVLDDVIDSCESYIKEKKLPEPAYNVEIKRHPDYDGIYHPDAANFAGLVYNVIKSKNIIPRTTIQSFDIESLQEIKKLDSDIQIALLVEGRENYKTKLESLGFSPNILSPYFLSVNDDMVKYCASNQMKLIPWTVNEREIIEKIIDMGVDGIISDYPDRVIEVLKKKSK